jgi:hypothetical protein
VELIILLGAAASAVQNIRAYDSEQRTVEEAPVFQLRRFHLARVARDA